MAFIFEQSDSEIYASHAALVADLEATIGEQVGETVGARLCARLKATSPRIYKDQLVALRGLLNGHPDLPQGLLERLLERPALTASQCREYFEAYAADPGRFVDPSTILLRIPRQRDRRFQTNVTAHSNGS